MYNYDWFVGWLQRNFVKPSTSTFNTSAETIAKNFTRSFFEVTEEDVIFAMKYLRFDYCLIDNKTYFSVDPLSPAFDVFRTHWD